MNNGAASFAGTTLHYTTLFYTGPRVDNKVQVVK